MERFDKVVETLRHKVAIARLWAGNWHIRQDVSLFRVIGHDLDKIFLIPLLGDKTATAVHRKVASHHRLDSPKGLAEAVLDWESARYTKPSKPLTARQTAERYYLPYVGEVMTICDRWGI